MRPKAGELGEAIAAASQARMTTIAAMRFFSQAPALGSEGEGHQSSVLAENLQRAAKARLASGLVSAGVFSALLAAAAVAAFFALPSARLALGQFAAAEAARAGIVLLPMAVAALLAFPLLAGPLLAAMRAAGNPGAVLKSEPARSMADGLKASALAAAAETENDMIAGYADALGALESKAGAPSHSAGDGAAWGWRRGRKRRDSSASASNRPRRRSQLTLRESRSQSSSADRARNEARNALKALPPFTGFGLR